MIQRLGASFCTYSRQKVLITRLFGGFFVCFLLFVECIKKYRLRSETVDFALHSTNGNRKGVHATNGNKADLNSVFTRQTEVIGCKGRLHKKVIRKYFVKQNITYPLCIKLQGLIIIECCNIAVFYRREAMAGG